MRRGGLTARRGQAPGDRAAIHPPADGPCSRFAAFSVYHG